MPFFVIQIENIVDRGQREEITSLASITDSVDTLRRSLEADQRSIAAMFDLCHAECSLLLERIKAQVLNCSIPAILVMNVSKCTHKFCN